MFKKQKQVRPICLILIEGRRMLRSLNFSFDLLLQGRENLKRARVAFWVGRKKPNRTSKQALEKFRSKEGEKTSRKEESCDGEGQKSFFPQFLVGPEEWTQKVSRVRLYCR